MADEELFPVTLPQQVFYYDYLLHRNESKYNMGGHMMLNGELDIDLFRKAYNYATQKYDSLRQRFVVKDGELFQYFLPEFQSNVEYYDFRNRNNPLEDANKFILEENALPFPFENSNLCREIILQTGDKQFIWFARFHHFSNDGYGHSIINKTVSDIYNSLLTDNVFPEIQPFSYVDFLEDDLRYRNSEEFKNSSEYWQKKLTPLPEPLDFTSKKHGIKNFSLHNERVTLNLHRMCYASMLNIGEKEGVSPFQTLLGILYVTLYKLYNKKDIIIGMPVLNRSNFKFKNTPGLFMNTTPLRLRMESDWTFSDLLNYIKAEVKECYRHQRLPLSEIFRHFRNNPEFMNELFDVTVIYRKMDFSQKFGNAKLHTVTLDTEIRNESFGMEIDEYDDDENVNIFFNYNPQVLSEQEVLQLAKCFETVLFELIYFPEKNLSEIKIISEFEKHKILKALNFNGTAKRTNKTIIEKFYECAQRYPDKGSVICNDESSTYSELNRKSNQFANYLIEKQNISKGDIICMAAERSIAAIVAMIGIMKSGAVCLPVDNNYPRERIDFILKNSGAKAIISDNPKHINLSEKVILISQIESSGNGNLSIEINKKDPAYIIYTSGSTGTPKGVVIEHGSFMNMFVNVIDNYGITERDNVLQFASLGFDAAVFEIFQALLTGATLVIASKEVIQDPSLFIHYMDDKKVSVATLPPAFLSALEKPEFPYLHTLITAGEQAVVSDVNHYRKFKKFINGYGPTEASVCASYFVADKNIEYKNFIPIGKPVSGTSIYILNDNLELLPEGFSGELCISGPNLARGYLNNIELTKQKFVANPFVKNGRMYRTGDRARLLPDGDIEFIGRIDDQVKIRGNRVELGEIENRIHNYPLVKDAVVLDADSNRNKVIAAFITSEAEIEISELRSFLLEFLPDYMIPQHFYMIGKIPLTQNGKINKSELRKMVSARQDKYIDNSAAPTGLELKLIPIVELVLNYTPVGVNDNFFELGGDSLKIARLITRIKKELNQEIGFKTIFDNPTVRSVTAELSSCKTAMYEEIKSAAPAEYYPLSHSQKRLWILAQDKENSAVYNMPVPLLLEGKVKSAILKKAVIAIIERHEALRTIFIDINGTPYQKVLATFDRVVTEYDFSLEKEAGEKARTLMNKEVMTPFDLSCEIPIRAHIVKVEEEKFLFLLMIHHIAGDGVSIGLIMNELAQLYNYFDEGESDYALEPLRIQYKDYCAYEQSLLESDKYLKEKEYWLEKLCNPLPVLDLPTDRMRPPVKTYKGNYLQSELQKSLAQSLFRFGKERSLSPYMVLMASVYVLLHKYTSQEDIIIGTPVAGRNHHNLENQVGVYINTVALRNNINGESTFSEFLEGVRCNLSEAFSNSNYPFDCLLENLTIERDISRAPLFDVLMQYQNEDVTSLKLNHVRSSFYEVDYIVNKFDLTFTFNEDNGAIKFNLGYNSNLFNVSRVERVKRHLINILTCVLDNPDICIKDIDVIDNTEREMLHDISSGESTNLGRETVLDLFNKQVVMNPDNRALVFNDIQLSYRQLDEKANSVAAGILKKINVSPDDIIAIMAPRSEMMVIGILGILKTGAAYLPLSMDMPGERVKFMMQESRDKLLLTESLLIEMAETCSDKVREIDIEPNSLAYVIYTSGSTGTPKGVMIEHRGLYNLVLSLSDGIYNSVSTPLNIAMIAPFIFDASVKQMFYALTHGHCLDIVPDEIKTNGRKLLEFYEKHSISVSDGTPVHLEVVLDELSPGAKAYLPDMFVMGGQHLMRQTVKKMYEVTRDYSPIIINAYGPTECSDVSSYFNITREFVLGSEAVFNSIPIGKPLNNVQIHILDSNLAQVPVGVNGELCIAGEGLARGYINREDLTKEKFVNASLLQNRRIYRTGDIGRYLDDGNIVLLGRSDDQIKLRGFRIELSEIESCIKNYNNIISAAVIAFGEGNNLEIAAYFSASKKVDCEELRHFLSLHLPAYMIPAFLMQLDKIPLTINGKVDKKALPLPVKETGSDDSELHYSDRLEEKLAGIWQELLQIKKISTNDSFFSLGGHSLIAIRLVSRIHKEFNIEIGIWEVFQYSTISSMAKLLRSKNPSVFNPIEKLEKRDYYPLSHSQRRLWFLARMEGQNSLYNMPGALILKGNLNVNVLEKVLIAIVQRHESFRTSFLEIEGEPFQKISDIVDFKMEVLDYSGETWDENTLKELACEYFKNEFDLTKAPLMQAKLVVLSEANYLFLINMHHIIGDGWSLDVILRELEIYYNSFLSNLEDPLEPLRIQYKDYATWQNSILDKCTLTNVKDYWHKKLSKPRPILNLPADYKRLDSFCIDGELLLYSLEETQAKQLREIARNENASLYMTLLTIVNILLYKYTGEEDILVGSPVAGRQHYDLENQVGFFVNTLVLRNEVNPENSFGELLKKVNITLSEAMDNQIYPFDRLVDELEVERIPNRNPLFDVMVAWMVKNGMEIKMNFSGIEALGLDFSITKSMFDLTFLFDDTNGKISYGIEYNTSLFRRESIHRMSDQFKTLLDSIISGPKEKIKNLDIIPAKEREKLLFEFNKTSNHLMSETNVINWFIIQVGIDKNKAAIVYEDRVVTYDELNRLSNRIANYIIENTALGKNDIIAVVVKDPVLSAASVLAIMKAGAAYLPILADNPPDRISFIIKDSNARVVLTDSDINISKGNEIYLDINGSISENESLSSSEIAADSLAYVIYTSGSTGVPKGVMIEHYSLSNLISSLRQNVYSRYKHSLNELMITSFAFDVSVKQIFASLCNGNTLHILSSERRLDSREIIKYIIGNSINVGDLTPSIFSVMLEEGFGEIRKPDLKELFLGSEALPYKLVKDFYNNSDNRGIIMTNFYGPTECCVESSCFRINPDDLNEDYTIVPIGRPILNESIYILDKFLNLCPINVAGEICIAGKGLARQYLNDPEKTAEKFVRVSSLNDIRIYKTGDLGRILPDGNIEFLGRMDEQVKIRGYRVELQEVEKCIRELKEINECIVTLFDRNGSSELAAYFSSDQTINVAKLKKDLDRFLPKYMIPSYFVQIEKIPLSSNGKANKKLLPDPVGIHKKKILRKPSDEIELKILQICSGVLKNEKIDLEDNFFEIGGNSLNAVRVISGIQKELNADIPLREIFYNPVLLDIAGKVKEIIGQRDTLYNNITDEKIIVPVSDEELKLLSALQFDDEE